MPLVEFDRKVYLQGEGDYARGDRYDLSPDVARRCVANEDAHYVGAPPEVIPDAPTPTEPAEVPHVESLPLGTGSDGPADRPSDPAPVISPSPEKAPATHKRRSARK